jgi:tetratricopeptide (TPR) repeat protein
MFYRGHADDAERLLCNSIAALNEKPPEERNFGEIVKLKINLVNIFTARDQFHEAFQELEAVEEIIQSSSLPSVQVLLPIALFTRANTCYIARMNEEAREWAEKARDHLSLLEGRDRMQLEQRINHLLARYYCRVMDFTKAMKLAQDIFPPGGGEEETVVRKEREAKIKALLGRIQKEIAIDMLDRGQEDYEEMLRMSRSFHLDARDLYRSLGFKRNEYFQLIMLSEVNLRLRYYEDAERQLNEGLEMARSMEQDPLVEMDIAERFAFYHLCLEEIPLSLEWMDKALEQALRIGDACLTDLIDRLRTATRRQGNSKAVEGLEKLVTNLSRTREGA